MTISDKGDRNLICMNSNKLYRQVMSSLHSMPYVGDAYVVWEATGESLSAQRRKYKRALINTTDSVIATLVYTHTSECGKNTIQC